MERSEVSRASREQAKSHDAGLLKHKKEMPMALAQLKKFVLPESAEKIEINALKDTIREFLAAPSEPDPEPKYQYGTPELHMDEAVVHKAQAAMERLARLDLEEAKKLLPKTFGFNYRKKFRRLPFALRKRHTLLFEAAARVLAETDPTGAIKLRPDYQYNLSNPDNELEWYHRILTPRNVEPVLDAVEHAAVTVRPQYKSTQEKIALYAIRAALWNGSSDQAIENLKRSQYLPNMTRDATMADTARLLMSTVIKESHDENPEKTGDTIMNLYEVSALVFERRGSQTLTRSSQAIPEDQPALLERRIREKISSVSADELKDIALRLQGDPRDRGLEDWALRAAPDHVEEVIAVIDTYYGEQAMTDSTDKAERETMQKDQCAYQAICFTQLLGVVEDSKKREALLSHIHDLTERAGSTQEKIIQAYAGETRLVRHPEVALRLIADGTLGSSGSRLESMLVPKLITLDLDAAMPYVPKEIAKENSAALDALLKRDPLRALMLIDRYTPGEKMPWNVRYSIILECIPPKKIASFINNLHLGQYREALVKRIINVFYDGPKHRQAFMAQLHELHPDLQAKFIGRYFPLQSWEHTATHVTRVDLSGWIELESTDESVRDQYLDRFYGDYQGMASKDEIRRILSLPELKELHLTAKRAQVVLLDHILRRPKRAETVIQIIMDAYKEFPKLDQFSLLMTFSEFLDKEDQVLEYLRSTEVTAIRQTWGEAICTKALDKILQDKMQNAAYGASFFFLPELTGCRDALGTHAEALVGDYVGYSRALRPEFDADKRFLQIVSAPQCKRIIETFPRYQNTFLSRIWQGPMLTAESLAIYEKMADQDAIGLCIYLTKENHAAFAACLPAIPETEYEALTQRMVAERMSWGYIAAVPMKDWPRRQEALKTRAETMDDDYPGAAVVRKRLETSLGTQEAFEANTKHLHDLETTARTAAGRGWPETTETKNANIVAVLGGQETIANKHLRDALEADFRDSSGFIPVEALRQLPERMHASLGLLRGRYRITSDELITVGRVWYSGKAIKKQTDLDRFNFFLLEGKESSREMAEFFHESAPIAQALPDAKKVLFDTTQLLRSFGCMEGNFGKRLNELNEFLKNFQNVRAAYGRISEKNQTIGKKREERSVIVQKEQERGAELIADLSAYRDELNVELIRIFKAKCGVALTPEETKRFFEHFEQPSLIFVYLDKLSAYPAQKKLFQQYIEGVAKGTFPKMRYACRVHLDRVFAGREKDEAIWRENERLGGVSASESSGAGALHQRVQDILNGSLVDAHMPPEILQVAKNFVDANDEEKQRILAMTRRQASDLSLAVKLSEGDNDARAAKIREGITKTLSPDRIMDIELLKRSYIAVGMPSLGVSAGRLDAALHALYLLKATGEELLRGKLSVVGEKGKSQDMDIEAVIANIKKACLDDTDVFANDLSSIEKILKQHHGDNTPSVDGRLIAKETVDPDLLLRLGTDVEGSCQNVHGSAEHNRNLVSYIMDGKIKALLVLDEDGKMVGRSILRILYADKAKTPVLHLERSYHRSNSPIEQTNKLLLSLAKEKARKLGYPLVVSGRFTATEVIVPYENDIVSYGGPGNTEYVDNIGGSQPDQKYTISSHQIQQVMV